MRRYGFGGETVADAAGGKYAGGAAAAAGHEALNGGPYRLESTIALEL